jgi:hypothetical protein
MEKNMISFTDNLNYAITEENYVKDLQELFMENDNQILSLHTDSEGVSHLETTLLRSLREKPILIFIKINFNRSELISIELSCEDDSDKNNYEMDLKLFYHEEVKSALFDVVNKKKNKYTIRNYRAIYNSFPIYGTYEINGDCKMSFHSLESNNKAEPLTEHIICFDILVEERNFERARTKAYNLTTDFCCYLSILLDIGFFDIQSKFVNFITTKYIGTTKVFSHERFRTAFYDSELKLFIKDNMNGLCPEKEMEKGNFYNGYMSISLNETVNQLNSENPKSQLKTGNPKAIEETFENHRLYKVKNNSTEYSEEISEFIHMPDQQIYIPRQIRSFFRGIEKCRKEDREKYIYFRNAARLYNKSHFMGLSEASLEISFLVASVEALAKCEHNPGFSEFIMKYCHDVDKKDLDAIYAIRSKLFHAGEFSFFEYEVDVNPFSDPLYYEFHNNYFKYKNIFRKSIIYWVKENLITD